MTVIRDIPLSLETGDVLRRTGFREGSRVRPEIKSLVLELLNMVEKTHLLEATVAYAVYSVADINLQQLLGEDGVVVEGRSLQSVRSIAREFAVIVGTIGPHLEEKAAGYFNEQENLRGLLLDGIGSAAVDSLTREICKIMAREASSRGFLTSSPISPGLPGLPITKQRQLLEMAGAGEIKVSLTQSGIMVPCKSASMIIGIGPQMATWTQSEVCAGCNLKKTCPYKTHA